MLSYFIFISSRQVYLTRQIDRNKLVVVVVGDLTAGLKLMRERTPNQSKDNV